MKPITRKEKILDAILSGNTDNIPTPITREEAYLKAIAENGGGGGESTGIWKPSVSDEGVISWEKSTSTVTPEEQNIKGPQGETGETGATGPQGPAGQGLASGGVAGSLLFKSSNDDYATEWVDSGIATVEGNPATAETDSAGIGVKTVVDIEPQQDLHGYDSPWVGGAGKNKLQVTATGTTTYGITWTVDADGVITANGTVPSDVALNAEIIVAGGWGRDGLVIGTDINLTVGNTYKLVKGNTNTAENFYLFISNSSGSVIDSANASNGETTFTIPSGGVYLNAVLRINKGATVSNLKTYPMIVAATESSDFAPYSNICPISGWTEANVTRTGKNLFDGEILYGYYDESGFVSSSGGWKAGNLIKCYPDTNYIASFSGAVLSNGNVFFYDKNKNYISYTPFGKFSSFKTPNNSEYFGFYLDTTSMPLLQQIELGNTATEYEPYNGATYTIDFVDGSNPLTVYGGTLDVESGTLTVDRGFITFDGSEDEIISTYDEGELFMVDYANFGDLVPKKDINGIPTNRISPSATRMGNAAFALYWQGLPSDVRTVVALRTWLASNNLQVCYELATPYTISLTPHQIKLLQGVNNLSTNAHSVSLTYRKGKVAMNSDLSGLADSVNVLADEVDSFGIKPLTATALSDAVIISTFSAMKINKNVIFSCRVIITPTEEGSMPLFTIDGIECPFYHTAIGRNNASGINGSWSIDKDTNVVMWTVVSTELNISNDILIQGVLAVK